MPDAAASLDQAPSLLELGTLTVDSFIGFEDLVHMAEEVKRRERFPWPS